ncbi:MAG: nickel-type superoxide dismutase maturation protease [Cyanophyceae cyanobacterium]
MSHDQLRSSRAWDLLLWLLRRRQRFRITGMSMFPLLKPGDEVLLDPQAYRKQPPTINDLVVAQHPQQPQLRLIKRVVAVLEDGCYLKGDNSLESTDSRSFGAVSCKQVLGRVTCRFP